MAITVPNLNPIENLWDELKPSLQTLTSESEGSGEILHVGMVSDPTLSRIIGEDSELLSWQRENAQIIKLRGANNCGTPVLENNIYLMSKKKFLSIILLQWKGKIFVNILSERPRGYTAKTYFFIACFGHIH